MPFADARERITQLERLYPDKFACGANVFGRIRRGDRIFVGTGCAEPRYLSRSFMQYARANPKAFFDAELSHLVALGITPDGLDEFATNFRRNFYFVADSIRRAVSGGVADYTPATMSTVLRLVRRGLISVDAALIQVSPPDDSGMVSLGVSVDIMKEIIERCGLIIAQVNAFMPYTHGGSTIDPSRVDFFVHHDEPLLEYRMPPGDEVTRRIGEYVSRLVPDGSTIQVGYGRVTNAVLQGLSQRRHLGVHTEILTDGIVDLMKTGVVDNTNKTLDPLRTVASMCMGSSATYDFIHDNPSVALMGSAYTNDHLTIARQEHMVAINSALQMDLTGQASSESVDTGFYSGIGGDVDFMRAVGSSPTGRTILVMPSTARGGDISRIVPVLSPGTGVTYNRADIQYVVTEYGICFIHGKNIRERAMALISVAHPRFRPWLVEEAKRLGYIPADQPFYPGRQGEYPAELETHRTTRTGLTVFLRPIKMTDEEIHKDFVYSLSEKTLALRFLAPRTEIPPEERRRLVVIDYTRHMAVLAVMERDDREEIIGIARYAVEGDDQHRAVLAVVVKDDHQNQGVGTVLLDYVIMLARKQGLLGFTAEIFAENMPVMRMLRRIRSLGHQVQSTIEDGMLTVVITFADESRPLRG